ncbi:uncharacterized protein LOC126381526 [Pectinophora gossypiella]|uniref:uncharacterized protein LOC126381526 n=1 Tax=Pectinophora gossypiella TaxID=13191 RepID=UPI00214EDE70|nr:uncharacterized protein LOC126381526 [Pectinophora gossypiella]
MEHKNCRLLGRLFNCPSKCGHVTRTCSKDNSNPTISRLDSQSRKICACATEKHYLPGNTVENLEQSEVSTRRKVQFDHRKGKEVYCGREGNLKGYTEASRTSEFCEFCCSTRASQPSSATDVSKLAARSVNKSLSITSRGLQRAQMVGSKLPSVNTAALSPTKVLPRNRCLRPGLGSTTEQHSPFRSLENRRTRVTQQPKRDAGYIARSSESRSSHETQFATNTVRQQDSGRSPTKRRSQRSCQTCFTYGDSWLDKNPIQ